MYSRRMNRARTWVTPRPCSETTPASNSVARAGPSQHKSFLFSISNPVSLRAHGVLRFCRFKQLGSFAPISQLFHEVRFCLETHLEAL